MIFLQYSSCTPTWPRSRVQVSEPRGGDNCPTGSETEMQNRVILATLPRQNRQCVFCALRSRPVRALHLLHLLLLQGIVRDDRVDVPLTLVRVSGPERHQEGSESSHQCKQSSEYVTLALSEAAQSKASMKTESASGGGLTRSAEERG